MSIKRMETLPAVYREFLENYGDYLRKVELQSPSTVSTYSRKLLWFLEHGYSVDDLCGAVFALIENHSKGGVDYTPKDHGNTCAALKKLRKLIFLPFSEDFYICYNLNWQSFPPAEKHISSYTLTQDELLVKYSKGFIPDKTVTRKIQDDDFYSLLKLIYENRHALSDPNTAFGTSCYSYTFGNKSANKCQALFFKKANDSATDDAQRQYKEWIEKHLS